MITQRQIHILIKIDKWLSKLISTLPNSDYKQQLSIATIYLRMAITILKGN